MMAFCLLSGCNSDNFAPTEPVITETVETSPQAEALSDNAPDTGEDATELPQLIMLSSVDNARHLGGYVTSDGRKVKDGLLIRTAKLVNISDEDMAALINDYNLGTIIDLRYESEIEDAPDPDFEGVEYRLVKVMEEEPILIPPSGSESQFKSQTLAFISRFENYNFIGYAAESYKTVYYKEQGISAIREFFDILLKNDENKAVLFHCTSGKDRTGVCAALVLTALGVDRETIVEDYLLTNVYMQPMIDALIAEASAETDDPEIYRQISAVVGVDLEMLNAFFDVVEAQSGSIENYLRQEIGLDDDDFEMLRDKYLEPAQ